MKNRKFQKVMMICGGTLMGLTTLSIARGAVPSGHGMRVTDDTALYQRLSEIKVGREARPNFDADIKQLSSLESRYREKLPSLSRDPRLSGPMNRIAKQAYRPSNSQAGTAASARVTQKPVRQ